MVRRMPVAAPVVHVVVSQRESWLTVAGQVAALIAAAAALTAILYARSTVKEARTTSAQLGEIGKAAQAGVTEQRATVETLGTAHREEMAERARALEAELVGRRLAQLERVSEVLLELVDVTQAEYVAPPYQLEPGKTLTRVPALLIRVQGAVAILAPPDEHVLAVDALKSRAECLERATRTLVPGVGLQLDPAAAPALERVRQLEELGLDVGASPPLGRMEPRPTDLDGQVLGPEREEPSRADHLSVRLVDRRERHLRARSGSFERAHRPVVPGRAGRRLHDREPLPGARVAGGFPEALLVLERQRLEPDERSFEDG